MLVVMMDANHISERLSSLKNEMSDLRVKNALSCNRKGYTTLERFCLCVTTSSPGGNQARIGESDETLCVGGQARGVGSPFLQKAETRLAFAVL
jgi:hypothetical protein